MSTVEGAGLRPVRMGELGVEMDAGADGVCYVRPRMRLADYPTTIIERLEHWARVAPDRTFLADRGPDGAWRHISFAEALRRGRSIAQYLIGRNLDRERPVAILSGNGIEHGLIALGAQIAGIPFAPVSPAYSLVSQDHAKLKHIFGLLAPGLVFAADGTMFAKALRAVMRPGTDLVVARNPVDGFACVMFDEMSRTSPGAKVDQARAAIDGDTVAKFLFTSGSTGMPKAVINTHRMIACNQVMIGSALAFLGDEPPVLVDWLPWNHTAGGNHNYGIALHYGGTLYIDDGSPTPAGIERTVRNLTEIAPTLYFNVPKGYEMLVDHLDRNDALRDRFFSRVKLLQYAGAGLAQHVWDSLERLAIRETGQKVMIITGYGSTETAPFACTTTWPVSRPGEVGLPAPGLELKLVPNGEKLELRLRGPNITPGYWRQAEATAASFDEEGFYRIGDALKLVDPEDVNRGFLFDGRVSEDFKLSTGTWVNMASVRAALVRAFAPFVRDVVLTGLDMNHIGALIFPDFEAIRRISPDLADSADADAARDPGVRSLFQARLDRLAGDATGSSNFVARAIILESQPSIDAHEVTDKGSINQRAVMSARADLVADLYAEPVPGHVLIASRKANS